MTLTTDSCGGPNPLVSLADRFRSSTRLVSCAVVTKYLTGIILKHET